MNKKGKPGEDKDDASKCVMFSLPDSQRHALIECSACPGMVHLRESIKALQFKMLDKIHLFGFDSQSPALSGCAGIKRVQRQRRDCGLYPPKRFPSWGSNK